MRICLVSPEHSAWGGLGRSRRRLAELLATRHEVTLIQTGLSADVPSPDPASGVRELSIEVDGDLERMSFACESHRRSAALLAAIEGAYGADGPGYLEVPDYLGHGAVPLQAKRLGHRTLRDTLFATRLSSSAEMVWLHDGELAGRERQRVCDLEREQLRGADRIVWCGGDTLDLYRRYYPFALPEGHRATVPLAVPAEAPALGGRSGDGPLRILYVGRFQVCKGALDLAEACLRLPRDDWELTMIGADTETAPLGQSARMTIEATFGDDPRLTLEGPLPDEELRRRWADHDLLVVPSRFDVWPSVALEAMRAGLPVLATPVGGLAEIVEPGVTGWHADGIGARPLVRALDRLLERRDEVEAVSRSGAVFERFRELCDPQRTLLEYERLLEPAAALRATRPGPRTGSGPSVTAIVPYYRASEFVEEAVGSALAQSHPGVEVLIVNDGSFEPEDDVLERLADRDRVSVVTQPNGGESEARNLGATIARGDYLAMLDADNVLEPGFVERALEVFGREPDLAYVSCWLRFIGPDGSDWHEPPAYAPLGNAVVRDDGENWDGDTLALMPRSLFAELGYRYQPTAPLQSDWELYRTLRDDGRFGAVVPERLARYRVVPESLIRTHALDLQRRSWNEAGSRRSGRSVRWTAEATPR